LERNGEQAAISMLDAFTSVGAQSFVVTKTDLLQTVKWGKTYSAAELREKLPAMVRTAATRRPFSIPGGETIPAGENLILRPKGPGVAFVQLDDLREDQLDRIRTAVFLIHATSPGSYQGWIAVSGVQEGKEQFKEFMRRVRKAVGGNDKSASHATRERPVRFRSRQVARAHRARPHMSSPCQRRNPNSCCARRWRPAPGPRPVWDRRIPFR
jgi:hypothetical protein